MNERIRLLAKQADIHFSKSGTLDAGPNGIAKFVLYADLERFAEKIVRECVQVSLKSSHRNDDMGAIIARNIQQHFGVNK